ncbi:MAG: hypothetical protein NDJ89_07420 [Oligoflexia bacterium]|nr:hypothetical protein [Oligoflexia bacterium]
MRIHRNHAGAIAALLVAFGAAPLSSCSTVKKITGQEKSAEEMKAAGPTVLNSRVEPGTIELTRDLKPRQPVEVLAEVKDFSGQVKDVRLRFVDVPIEVPMKNVAGSTWSAALPDNLVKKLAVGNQTTTYEANIYAKNDKGKVGVSKDPLKVAVKAPDLSKRAG